MSSVVVLSPTPPAPPGLDLCLTHLRTITSNLKKTSFAFKRNVAPLPYLQRTINFTQKSTLVPVSRLETAAKAQALKSAATLTSLNDAALEMVIAMENKRDALANAAETNVQLMNSQITDQVQQCNTEHKTRLANLNAETSKYEKEIKEMDQKLTERTQQLAMLKSRSPIVTQSQQNSQRARCELQQKEFDRLVEQQDQLMRDLTEKKRTLASLTTQSQVTASINKKKRKRSISQRNDDLEDVKRYKKKIVLLERRLSTTLPSQAQSLAAMARKEKESELTQLQADSKNMCEHAIPEQRQRRQQLLRHLSTLLRTFSSSDRLGAITMKVLQFIFAYEEGTDAAAHPMFHVDVFKKRFSSLPQVQLMLDQALEEMVQLGVLHKDGKFLRINS